MVGRQRNNPDTPPAMASNGDSGAVGSRTLWSRAAGDAVADREDKGLGASTLGPTNGTCRLKLGDRRVDVRLVAFDFIRFAGNDLDVAVVIDALGTMLAVSESIHPLLGHDIAPNIGRSVVDFVHPDDLPLAVAMLEAANEIVGTTRSFEIRIRHADGRFIPLDVMPRNMLASDGIMILTCRDISDRLRVQAERSAEEERFRAVALCAPIAIFKITIDGACEFVNERWTELTGQSSSDALGAGWLDVVDRHDQLRLVAIQNGVNDSGSLDLTLHNRGGGRRNVIGRWVAISTADGGRAGYVGTMEDVTERRTLEERLLHQATHDSLTGLPNRLLLNEHLARILAASRRSGDRVGVIFCDLDRFKVVNDSLGHETGDHLLKAVARRFGGALRASDVVGRFGGDEFIVLVSGPDDDTVRAAANRLRSLFDEPFEIGLGRPYAVTASIGIALSDEHSTSETLLRDADVAMYRAKERGRGRAEEFDERLRERALDRLALMNDLPYAVANGELIVLYQPIVKTQGNELSAVEALVRWRHPTRGELSPDAFIALAEETGSIVAIGDWVMEQACRDLLSVDEVTVNVNLSALQVRDGELADRVAAILLQTGFPASRLVLEITESVLMHDMDTAVETLRRLKALGVSITVDDFGTGYSSLSYLSVFPIDALKVDRSFVRGMTSSVGGDNEIIRTVISLAHSLGLRATAEGVETSFQLDALQRLGCDFAQGFLFDEALSIECLRDRWANGQGVVNHHVVRSVA